MGLARCSLSLMLMSHLQLYLEVSQPRLEIHIEVSQPLFVPACLFPARRGESVVDLGKLPGSSPVKGAQQQAVSLTTHCTLHTAHCTLHTAHCTLHTAISTTHTAHSTKQTAHCLLLTAHCTPHTANSTTHTAHCTLHTAHRKLRTARPHNAHCALCTAHCTLHTANCTHHRLSTHTHYITLVLHDPQIGFAIAMLLFAGRDLPEPKASKACPRVCVCATWCQRCRKRPNWWRQPSPPGEKHLGH